MTPTLEQSLKALVSVFRRESHKALGSERTSICSADQMLMALQLAMAETKREENGEFSASLSDILVTWKYLLKDKLNLHHEGAQASENYDLVRKHYDSFLKRSNMVDLTDIHGLYNQLKMESEPVAPVTAMQLFEFLSENSECSGEKDASKFVPACPSTPSNRPSQSHSQLLKAVKRLLCAYLNLLVNSKNDLALAHVLNIPDRGLGRVAFTDLKHAARNKQTSLFLAATSFVRAIQLGGKGYAPSETDPLRKHIKGLSDFVHFTDNLEELLGEIPDPSLAGGRMMTLIKMALLKGRSSGDPVCRAAEEALQELKQRISCINDTRKQATNPAGTGISPARPKAHTINHETAYGGREMVKVLLTLLDEEALCPPTRNKAKVLSAVEEGLELSAGACIVTLFRSPEQSNGSSPKPLRARIQERENQKPKVKGRAIRSQFAITYKDEDAILNRVLQFPSLSQVPTWVHPAPKPGHHPYSSCDDQSAAGTDLSSIDGGNASEDFIKRAAFGSTSGNAQQKGNPRNKGKGCANGQPGSRGCKRKPEDINHENIVCSQENQPPHKRTPTRPPTSDKSHGTQDSKARAPGKKSKAAAKTKLIAGQGKLTNFFRL